MSSNKTDENKSDNSNPKVDDVMIDVNNEDKHNEDESSDNNQPEDAVDNDKIYKDDISDNLVAEREDSERTNFSETSLNSEDDLSLILATFEAEVDNPSQNSQSGLPQHLTLSLPLTIVQEDINENDIVSPIKETKENFEELPHKKNELQTHPEATKSPPLPQHLTLGLTLSTIRTLLSMQKCSSHNNSPSNEPITGYRAQVFARNWGAGDNLTVCQKLKNDLELSSGIGKANIFVCWAQSTTIEILIDALEQFLQHESLQEESTFFWVSSFVLNHNEACSVLERYWLGECVRSIGCTILLLDPWNSGDSLMMAHCIEELYFTHMANAAFHLVMRKDEHKAFEKTLFTDIFSIMNMFSNINVANIDCEKTNESKTILYRIRDAVGFSRCTQIVVEQLKNAIATHARKSISRLPKEERAVTNLLSCISIIMEDLGRHDEAGKLKEEAIIIGREVLGPKDRNTLTRMSNFAAFLRQQGRFKEAQSYYEEVLIGRREVLGPTDPDTLLSMSNYAVFLKQQGYHNKARSLYEEALKVQRTVLGSKHRNTLSTIIGLALLLHEQGHANDARIFYEEAVFGYREVFGSMHSYTLTVIHNFACFLRDEKHYDEARPLFDEAIAGRRVTLGPSHPHTLWSMFFLNHLGTTK